MKYTFILLIAFLFISFTIHAQGNAVKKFYRTHKKEEGSQHIKIGGPLVKLASMFPEEKWTKQIIRKVVKKVRFLTFEDSNPIPEQDRIDLLRDVENDQYEKMVKVKSPDGNVDVLIRNTEKHITDVLVLMDEENTFTLVSMKTKLKFSELPEYFLMAKNE